MPRLETAAKTDDHDNRKLVKIGDFAINSRSDRRGSCGISMYEGSVSLINTVLEPREKMVPEYFNYLFHTKEFADEFYRWGHGIVDDLWTTRWQDMKSMKVPCPPLTEQMNIATFLDQRCGAIDEAKKIIASEIESLRRLRKATIFKAVTKGVDDSVLMRASGVDWIGLIPDHWSCCKQKHAMKLINGRAYSNEEFEADGKYRILRVGNLFSNPNWYTSSLELPNDKYCEDGDLLYSWSMSYGPHVWHGEKAIYHYHIWKVSLTSALLKPFAYYYLLALTDAIQAEIHETTMGFLTMGIMNDSYLALPPIGEQEVIASYLDERCAAIDSIIDARTKQLERLEDYRKALIYAYVTGKKEVPAS